MGVEIGLSGASAGAEVFAGCFTSSLKTVSGDSFVMPGIWIFYKGRSPMMLVEPLLSSVVIYFRLPRMLAMPPILAIEPI